MAKKKRLLLVEENGDVYPNPLTVDTKKINKIKWLPTEEGGLITITFGIIGSPFESFSFWPGPDTELTGTLKKFGPGKHEFNYVAERMTRGRRIRGDAQLIVDGGRRKSRKAPKKK